VISICVPESCDKITAFRVASNAKQKQKNKKTKNQATAGIIFFIYTTPSPYASLKLRGKKMPGVKYKVPSGADDGQHAGGRRCLQEPQQRTGSAAVLLLLLLLLLLHPWMLTESLLPFQHSMNSSFTVSEPQTTHLLREEAEEAHRQCALVACYEKKIAEEAHRQCDVC
jgi:hypothetical protein